MLGNLSDIMQDRLGFLQRMACIGDVCGFHFGPFPGMLFNKPEHIQSILVEHASDFDKGVELIYHSLAPAFRKGIFFREGDLHRRQRKLMAPIFQPRHIASYANCMGAYSETLQKTWSTGSVIDITQQMRNLTMSILGKVLFDADAFTASNELAKATIVALEYLSHVTSALIALPYSWPTARNRRMYQAIQVARTCIQRFIDERRAGLGERNDFLSILLQARDENGACMSDDQLMAECLNLFGAGYETTATGLSWMWLLLCQHPEIYRRVQQEVASVLQGRTPTYADLAHLPYCLQVWKEALRLYPPVYFISRRTLREIEIDGHRVPKGGMILLSPYTLHRRADYFPEPEKFDPERFTPEQEKRRPHHAYIPFGTGPRICLGLHFAMMEGHLLFATIAQRATFSLVPNQTIEIKPRHSLLLQPASAINMVVTKPSDLSCREQCLQPLHGSSLGCPQAEV